MPRVSQRVIFRASGNTALRPGTGRERERERLTRTVAGWPYGRCDEVLSGWQASWRAAEVCCGKSSGVTRRGDVESWEV